jgi:diguanylate cyclase (GGDEF)-like protein
MTESNNYTKFLYDLHSILYGTGNCSLNPEPTEEPYQYLGQKMQSLETAVEERLAHSNGSPAFQLQEKGVDTYSEFMLLLLLLRMLSSVNIGVLVVDAKTQRVVYCNSESRADLGTDPCAHCCQRDRKLSKLHAWQGGTWECWELHTEEDEHFHISSYPMIWRDRCVYVHVVSNVTVQTKEKDALYSKAYFDPLTSIYNRHFFEEYMEKALRERRILTVCYLDLDGLKYVNDHYGHKEGDWYISVFADLVRRNFRSEDVFARIGGDEFCLVMEGDLYYLAKAKLERVRTQLIENNDREYPVSFSYGVCEVDWQSTDHTMTSIIREADARMYDYKQKYKLKRA